MRLDFWQRLGINPGSLCVGYCPFQVPYVERFSAMKLAFAKYLSRLLASQPRARRTRPLELECLEDRVTPSVVISPNFGLETQNQDGSAKLNSPPVFLTYWGSYWGGTNTPQANAIRNAAAQVLDSAYLNGTSQYGTDGRAFLNNVSTYDSSNPANPFRRDSAIQDVINNQIDRGLLPEADTPTHTPIYVVVTPPGIRSDGSKNGVGFNTRDTDTDPMLTPPFIEIDEMPEVWVSTRTKPDGTLDLDDFTRTLSHEVAEVMTDFGQRGFEVNSPTAWASAGGGGDGQIGDKEGNAYEYRLANGALVQPYWSRADSAWLATDGNIQTVNATAAANAWTNTSKGPRFNGRLDVTVDGDQRPGNPNDFIQVGTATLGGTTVLQINLNGEFFQFDAGRVANLFINTGVGNDTVIVNPVPGNPKISIRAGSSGSSANATITAQAPLTIVQEAGANLNITAQAPVTVNGIQGSITIANQSTTTINATSSNNVFVTQNSGGSGGTNLFIKNAGAVNVGAGNVGNITSDLVISNAFGITALTVDDSHDGAARTWYVDGPNVSFGLGTILYRSPASGPLSMYSIDVETGTGSNTVNVLATRGRSLNLHGHSADTAVFVGLAGSLAGIKSLGITISNPIGDTALVIDDSNRRGNRVATIDTLTTFAPFMLLKGLAPATIYVQRSDTTRNVDVYTGIGAVRVNVLGTIGRGLNLIGNSANTEVFVGNGSVAGILGLQMTISNPIGDTALVIDDHNRGGNLTATIDTLTTFAPFMRLTDLIPGTIYVQRSDTTRNVDLYTGMGAVRVNVLGTIGRGLNLIGNSADTQVFVGNNGSLAGIQGLQMTISNRIGIADTGVVINGNRGVNQTATIDTLTTDPRYLQLTDLIPGTTIYVQRTTTTRNVDIYTGTGVVTVNVLATIGRGLNLHGNSPTTTVNVGKNGSLDGIRGLQMTISNTNGDTAVVIDDRNRGGIGGFPRTATFDTFITPEVQALQLTDLIPGTIYVQRSNVEVYTGTSVVIANVRATIGRGLILHGNSPNTTVNFGKNGSLDGIQGPVTVNGITTVNFDDSASPAGHEYNLYADHLQRFDSSPTQNPDMALISFAGMKAIALQAGHGPSNGLFVIGSSAGTTVDVYGTPGSYDVFFPQIDDSHPLLGPVHFHGQAADNDFAYYYDVSTNPETYTFSIDPLLPTVQQVDRSGAATVTYDSVTQVILYTPVAGGNTVNVQGVSSGEFLNMANTNGDHITIGSQAPAGGGTLANILGPVAIGGDGKTGLTVTIDDSADTTGRQVTIDPPPPNNPADPYTRITGLAPAQILWNFAGGSAQISVLGGSGDDSFAVHGAVPDVALSLDGGGGVNTLDYSAYTTGVTINLAAGTATDLAGIVNFRNAVGGSGNNILVGNGGNVLTGGPGRDLLIGGGSASILNGGGGEDILIGGTTAYDTNPAALEAIMAEWAPVGADPGYDTRVANLQSGAGGVPALNANTVHSNGQANQLTGGTERDLFFASLASELIDWDSKTEKWIVIA